MLLSDPQVAERISQDFVLCWNSLRPVPKVTIDFGNGKVLERTIKGNTAFQVCRSDGTLVDSLPGVMTPRDFLEELEKSLRLTRLSDEEILQFHREPVLAQNPPARLEAVISKAGGSSSR